MFARTPRLIVASLAVAAIAVVSPLGHAAVAHASDVTIDYVSPNEVTAGSQARITLQCLEGCDAQATITVGDVSLSGSDITYDSVANTEAFTLPDSLAPGTYDVTVSAPDGGYDTLNNALTVDGPPDVSLSGISPDTVVAGSGAKITISCDQGCDDSASVSVGEADITEESVAYDPTTNTETFTLPKTVDPGIYDVTVTEPDGRSDTLHNALTVEQPLTMSGRVVNPVIHAGSIVRMYVQTNAGANHWGANVYSAGLRALPHSHIDYQDRGNGSWKVSFTVNQHVAPGLKQIVLWATMGSQRLCQTYTFTVVR